MKLRSALLLASPLALAALLLLGCKPEEPSPPRATPAAGKGVLTSRPATPAAQPRTPASPERQPAPKAKPKSAPASWKTYRGAWFTIEYPASFKVVPREKSKTGNGYDGVSFISPDGRAEFYVNSPQWQGEPGWIDMTPGEDITASQSIQDGPKQTTRVTVRGPDGAYTRVYEDTTDTADNTRLVFGYKYRNEQVRQQYHGQYGHFKGSLQQFAD